MSDHYTDDKANKNCHEYCPYGKMCRYCKGEIGLIVDECSMYYKLDDLMNEARDIEREERRRRAEEEFEECEDW